MIALIQRVRSASVDVEGDRVGSIGPGLLALVGVAAGDGTADADRLLDAVLKVRLDHNETFSDWTRRMARVGGAPPGSTISVNHWSIQGISSRVPSTNMTLSMPA